MGLAQTFVHFVTQREIALCLNSQDPTDPGQISVHVHTMSSPPILQHYTPTSKLAWLCQLSQLSSLWKGVHIFKLLSLTYICFVSGQQVFVGTTCSLAFHSTDKEQFLYVCRAMILCWVAVVHMACDRWEFHCILHHIYPIHYVMNARWEQKLKETKRFSIFRFCWQDMQTEAFNLTPISLCTQNRWINLNQTWRKGWITGNCSALIHNETLYWHPSAVYVFMQQCLPTSLCCSSLSWWAEIFLAQLQKGEAKKVASALADISFINGA